MQNANMWNVNKIKNVNKYINASDERLHDAAAVMLTSFINATILGLLKTFSFSSSGVRYLSFRFGICGVHTLVIHGNRFGSNKFTNAFIEAQFAEWWWLWWWWWWEMRGSHDDDERLYLCKYYACTRLLFDFDLLQLMVYF